MQTLTVLRWIRTACKCIKEIKFSTFYVNCLITNNKEYMKLEYILNKDYACNRNDEERRYLNFPFAMIGKNREGNLLFIYNNNCP